MRQATLVLGGLVLSATLGLAQAAAAQPVATPTIHRVNLRPDTGVLTIAGTGLGPDLQVTVDGLPVPQLPGATDTQMEVLAPVTVVTMPGTYRLTVVDPMRRVGDGFVVAGPMGSVQMAGDASQARVPADRPPTAGEAATSPSVGGPADKTVSRVAAAPSPLAVIEDSGDPYRTAIGYQALFSNTTGNFNTASGYQALFANTAGNNNTASGMSALTLNTTGNLNTASGAWALFRNTTGSFDTASGYQVLFNNSTGHSNTASGLQALYNNTTGFANTASGYRAGYNATTGNYNLFVGADVTGAAADTNTIRIGLPYGSAGTGTGQNSTFIAGIRGTTVVGGEAVLIDANGKLGSGALSIGASSVGSAEVIDDSLTTSDLAPDAVGTSELAADAVTAAKVAFNYAASAVEGGPAIDVVCVGCVSASEVGFSFASLGANTFTGTQTIGTGNLDLAPSTATAGNMTKNGVRFLHNFGTQNTFVGMNAGNLTLTGANNTASGAGALASNTTGGNNTASGATALFFNTTGNANTASGVGALFSNTTGSANTISGEEAFYNNTAGNYNTADGFAALFSNTTGSRNTVSGAEALYRNTTGTDNTASGYEALLFNTTGTSNTASGFQALFNNSTGQRNVALGVSAGYNATTGSSNVFLGADVTGTAADTNTIRLGLPYDSGTGAGQSQTFIAGIRGTQLTGSAVQVFIDANGQLGTLTPPIASGSGTTPVSFALQQQVQEQHATVATLQRLLLDEQQQSRDQQATNADLRARLARLETLMTARGGRK